MAMYRALVKCFVDNGIRDEGDIFNYEGPENDCLEPVEPVESSTARITSDSSAKKWKSKARASVDDGASA